MEQAPWPPPAPNGTVTSPAGWRRDDGAVLGGVARDLGARTSVDPLWFRIAFVVLTAFSGLGILLYAGVWLILRGHRRSSFGPLVIAGIAVVVVSCAALLDSGTSYIESPWTIVAVLAGVAVALWQPRGVPAADDEVGHEAADDVVAGTVAPDRAPPPPTLAAVRESPPPSALGRWALAAALLVGAAGAFVYQVSGDGLHPERWLGAAAAVCGIGIVIGAWRGRALWLVLPAVVFAGAGFVAGHAARAGVDEIEVGTRDFQVGALSPFAADRLPPRDDLVAGEIEVTVYAELRESTTSDLRVGLGVIDILVDDDVTVDVHAQVHDGEIIVDGDERPHDGEVETIRIGLGETPDVEISATISVGRLEINQRPLRPGGFPSDEGLRD